MQRGFGDKVELTQTPTPMKQTVLTLLEYMPDDGWIYGFIDDKYLLLINLDVMKQVLP
jgi:hypothetical protein